MSAAASTRESTASIAVGRRTIAEAQAALARMAGALDGSFEAAVAALTELQGHVLTFGVGKSGIAATKVAATFRSTGLPAIHLSPMDFLHGDLGMVAPSDVAVLFSKSGMTRELLTLLPHLRARRASVVGILGDPLSPLARACDLVLDVSVEREGGPLDCVPMASVLAAQAMGDALAAAVMQARQFTREDFARLHPQGALGARVSLSVADVMRRGNDLPLLTEDATFKQALIEMTRTGYGALCVVSAERTGSHLLTGFLTDGDVRRLLLSHDDISTVRVADVMTTSPITVGPEMPLSDGLQLLERRPKALLAAPVVLQDGRCVGLLRLHDAVQAHLRP